MLPPVSHGPSVALHEKSPTPGCEDPQSRGKKFPEQSIAGQGMRLPRMLVAGLSAALLVLGAASAASAATDAERLLESLNKIPPMEFFIAKGAPDACGPGCDSWIAAGGRIVAETPAKLRKLLKELDQRKLPIFFSSPGGKGYEA